MDRRSRCWLSGTEAFSASVFLALLGCDGSQPSEPLTAPTFAVTAPTAPSNPSAVALAFDTIKVAWSDNSTNESGFQVHRSTTGSTGAYSLRATRPANGRAFRDAKVSPLTSYCYKIRAFRTLDGETRYSAFSSAVCAKTPAAPRPAAPSGAVAKPASSTSVDVSWTDQSSNETGFRVKRSLDGGSTWSTAGTVAANVTAYQDGGRAVEQQVCYRVVAFNAVGTASSNTDCTTPPAAPSNLTATSAEAGISLSWADNSAAEDGYEVQRSTDGTMFAAIANVSANSTSYSDAGAISDRNYWYRVRASKDGGLSDLSNVASARGVARPTTQIAYVSVADGNAEIYVINDDRTGATRLTFNPASDTEPAWSPDRRRIAFTSNRDGAAEVYVMAADGSNATRLTTGGGSQPAWSPEGTRIAFVRRGDIYVVNTNGSALTQLTFGGEDGQPAWSPDGNKIAFNRGGGISVMSTDGSNLTLLTAGNQPAWSPDGAKLAFWLSTHCSPLDDFGFCFTDIFTMNADGSAITQLTHAFWKMYTDPTWSLDGRHIAYQVECHPLDGCPGWMVWTIAITGMFEAGLADGFSPSWRQ